MTETPRQPPEPPVPFKPHASAFLSTFGQKEEVLRDAADFWREKGFGSPTELYNHLMDVHAQKRGIAPQRAEILKQEFAKSFAPEHSTGYLHKHRSPLVDDLARIYVTQTQGTRPLAVIEGDIGNLGGLNNAMKRAAKNLERDNPEAFAEQPKKSNIRMDKHASRKLGRIMADKVMHAICEITRNHIAEVADFVPIRSGGDEMRFYASLKEGVTMEALNAKLKEAQKDVAAFVTDAGLKHVPRKKKDQRKAGVGVGFSAMILGKHSSQEEAEKLHAELETSKLFYDDLLHSHLTHEKKRTGTERIETPDIPTLSATLEKRGFAQPDPIPTETLHALGPNPSNPDHQRYLNLMEKLGAKSPSDLTPGEQAAVFATTSLTRKYDPVAKLPFFVYAEQEQLPHFKAKIGNVTGGAKLLHADFTGIAAGNKFCMELGNAMALQFSHVMVQSLSQADSGPRGSLAELANYLSTTQGGKYVMLLPGAKTYDGVVAEFGQKLQDNLEKASHEPLKLPPEVLDTVRKKLASSQELQKLYGPKGERLFDKDGNVSMANLINPSTKLPGVRVAVAVSPRTLKEGLSLSEQLAPLESRTDFLHKQMARQRIAEGEQVKPSFASQVAENGAVQGRGRNGR